MTLDTNRGLEAYALQVQQTFRPPPVDSSADDAAMYGTEVQAQAAVFQADSKAGTVYEYFDAVYLGIYTAEFFAKVMAQPRGYWKNNYDVFDFLVLVISYFQLGIDALGLQVNFTYLRVIRGNAKGSTRIEFPAAEPHLD
jgi:hypothetical protein